MEGRETRLPSTTPPNQPPSSSNPHARSTPSWSQILRGNHIQPPAASEITTTLPSLERLKEKTKKKIIFSPDQLRLWQEPWQRCLIGKFLRRPPTLLQLRADVAKAWTAVPLPTVSDMENAYFLFTFRTPDEAAQVMTEGPWTFRGDVLHLMAWKPNFSPLLERITSAPVWARLPGLPIEFWQEDAITEMAAMLGKVLKLDPSYTRKDRTRFVRVCVEIDLASPLTQSFWIGEPNAEGSVLQVVSYENLPLFCNFCGCIGHRDTLCPKRSKPCLPNPPTDPSSSSTPAPQMSKTDDDQGDFGPWIRVQKRFPPKSQNRNRPTFASNTSPARDQSNQHRQSPRRVVSDSFEMMIDQESATYPHHKNVDDVTAQASV